MTKIRLVRANFTFFLDCSLASHDSWSSEFQFRNFSIDRKLRDCPRNSGVSNTVPCAWLWHKILLNVEYLIHAKYRCIPILLSPILECHAHKSRHRRLIFFGTLFSVFVLLFSPILIQFVKMKTFSSNQENLAKALLLLCMKEP